MSKELQIRNSTVDFLVFTRDAGEDGIEVRVQNGDVWLTQKAISQLFDVDRSVVTKHLSNIFKEGELDENSDAESFQAVADATLAYHKKGQIEYIPFPDKLKGRYQAFTQADLTNLRAAGYDKPFKTVAEGVTEYMAWLNRDA